MDDEARRISSPHLYGALRLLANRCRYSKGWEDGDATCMEAAARLRELGAEVDALKAELVAVPAWLEKHANRREDLFDAAGSSVTMSIKRAIERGDHRPTATPAARPSGR